MTKKFKETYVLNVAKWRCGGHQGTSDNAMGEGDTSMINREGYMCCLGQFAKKSVEYDDSDNDAHCDPSQLAEMINCEYDKNFVTKSNYGLINTELSDDLIYINDDCTTTPKRKIELIREKLAEKGLGLRVLNANILG